MKRSKAIETIEWLLTISDQKMNKKELAEVILYNLEKSGMKPPIKKKCPVLFREEFVWTNEND